MDSLDFRIMGPFEVHRDGVVIAAGGGRRRALLAALVVSANEAVSAGRLREVVWGEREPTSAANLVHGYISDWRAVLEPGRAGRSSGRRLLSRPGGYELRLAPGECDALRFATLVERARASLGVNDLGPARDALGAALKLRRGVPLAEFAAGEFETAAAAIEEDWVAALCLTADVDLLMDRADRALALLERPMADRPLREDLVALGMRALYRLGRQGDALALFELTRRALADELGADPGPALVRLHRRILLHDPALNVSASVSRIPSLPVPLSSFVGREADLDVVIDLIHRRRLVTLTGVGGSGKTRLAIEVARRIASPSADGVAFVDAASLTSADLLWPAIATAAGLQLIGTMPALDALLIQLGQRRVTLVLDNLEHLAAAGPGVARMLTHAGGVSMLATSRSPLGVPGEQLFSVDPLPVPASDSRDLESVLATPSAQMFLDRARAADPSFKVTEDDAMALGGICRRLDGLPLALEFAATWTRTLTLSGLFERLDRPLDLLAAAPGPAWPDRHRTMRSVIEWSYAALTDSERVLLDCLSGFKSGACLDTLESIVDLGGDLLPALTGLMRANLAHRVGAATTTRIRLLHTVRDFTVERRAARPDDGITARARHAQWFRELAERTARASGTPGGGSLTVRMGEEQAEIRATLDYLGEVGEHINHLTLIVDCLPLWWELGHIAEGYQRVTTALDAVTSRAEPESELDPSTQPTRPELLAAAEIVAACLAECAGRPQDAARHERNATSHARRAESPALELLAQTWTGSTMSWADWHGSAEEGLDLLKSAAAATVQAPPGGPPRWGWADPRVVRTMAILSLIDLLRYRDPVRARSLVHEVRDDAVGMQDSHLAAFTARALGFLHADAGRYDLAAEALTESLELAARSGSSRNQARTLEELARMAWAQADIDRADGFAIRATALSRDGGHALNWARCATLLSDVRLCAGDRAAAAELLAEAEQAIGPNYPDLAMRMLLPRRARLARLRGDLHQAAHHLGHARALDDAEGLTPDRITYLIEAAHEAAANGGDGRQRTLIDTITSACSRLGLVVPEPELTYLRALDSSGAPEKVQRAPAR